MQVHIGSRHLTADVALALDVAGREHLVVVVKSTWSIPQPGQRPRPLPPLALVTSDDYHGEPGASPLRYGDDLARFKPRCDVLFDALAHSPVNTQVHALHVLAQVGTMNKHLRVTGPRKWRIQAGTARLTAPQPFTTMPLHHGLAFGGTRWFKSANSREDLSESLLTNPVGLGFAGANTLRQVNGESAPCLEDPDDPVRRPDGKHRAAALSAVSRYWLPRKGFAGTYDQAWKEEVFPLLPADFDEQFHQCAPRDQQIDYPTGGEPVRLLNMCLSREDIQFNLPRLALQVRVLRSDYSSAAPSAVVDTLYFEPEHQRFSAVWRASLPLRRRLQEIQTVAVGPIDPLWWQDQLVGGNGRGCVGCSSPAEELPTAAA